MTLNLRFTLLIGLLLALFLGGVGLLTSTQRAETARTAEVAQQERSQLLDEIISLVGYPLAQFTRDYSLWDEMADFLKDPSGEWARINIDASVDTFHLRAAWVLRTDGSLVYAAKGGENAPALPVPAATLREKLSREPFASFFFPLGDGLCEFRAAPIQPSADTARTTPAQGWLIAAYGWDEPHLETLGKLTGAHVTIDTAQAAPATLPRSEGFEIVRPLPGPDGAPVASLKLHYTPAGLASIDEFNRDEILIFLLQGLLLIAATTLCIQRWVLNPVRQIITSLREGDAAPIATLAIRNDETGLIARLVQSHFADRRAIERSERTLAHTLAERTRLGRDLHDNVIQSLFATGMGLTALRNARQATPAEVEAGLDRVKTNLNEVIRDVRAFIVGLEPESLDGKTFSEAVSQLADALRAIRTIQIDIDIDETAAHALPPDLRHHALQLLRETLLNSVRHSGASHIQLSLLGSPDHVILAHTDDGRHASAAENTPAGLGLASIAERVSIVGATCEITPLPQSGTRIRVLYPRSESVYP
jgi:signal transduction histidine kinase